MFENVEVNSIRWFNLGNLLNEEWKDVKGYEELYQISNYGRVKSLTTWNGNKYKKSYTKRKKILKCTKQDTCKGKTKYYRYCVRLSKNKKSKYIKIHQLVAQAFIPNPNNYIIINHIDGNPLNNLITNLEWCTPKENSEHYQKYLRKKPYDENKILEMVKENIKPNIIQKENNISVFVYYNILKRNNIMPQGISYWQNKYNINLEKLKNDFAKGFKNKELAIKYNTNSNLIAKYREKYKKGEI